MANWHIVTPMAGLQPIEDIDTVQNHPLGTIVRAKHDTHGEAEFIYLEGVANTLTGHGVTYHTATFQTALASIVGGVSAPVAIAMAACVADRYGWYQISGRATVRKATATSFAAGAALGITSGLAVAAVTNKRLGGAVLGAAVTGSSALTSCVVAIDRPRVSTAAET